MKTQAVWSILHAEDDENDAFFVRRAIDKIVPSPKLTWAENGRDALAKLGVNESSPRESTDVNVVLVDINMPKMSGFEFLSKLRKDARFNDVFVLMLSASSQPRDQQQAKELGANGYLVKPNDWAHFEKRIERALQTIATAKSATEWLEIPA